MTPNLFGKLNIKDEKLHQKFLYLRDEPTLFPQKKQLEKWFEGFQDRDNKIVKEFQTTFHSTFWEIYLHAAFKEMGYEIDFSHDRPDFILKGNPNIMVEATVANIKEGGKQEDTRNDSNLLNMFTPPVNQPNFDYELKEAIARYGNSIRQKNQKFHDSYKDCDWVTPENPYVIALSSFAQVDYGRDYIYGIIALLYGRYFIPEKNDFISLKSVTKNGSNAEIPLGIFLDESYSDVSAVIFSTTTTLGKLTSTVASNDPSFNLNRVYNLYRDFQDKDCPYKLMIVGPNSPEILTDGLFVFHNPNAKNPLSLETFNTLGITQYNYDTSDGLLVFGNPNPTISRLSIAEPFSILYESKMEQQLNDYNEFAKNKKFILV
ncbi:hypothetical protein CON50_08895 [Bacillus anthracis]|nr:hypothetical protein CON50_08895 [Bacillus anthracis]